MDKPKKKFKWWYILIAVVVIGVIGSAIGGGSKKPPVTADGNATPAVVSTPAAVPTATPKPEPATVAVDMDLSSGHYVSGTDFPAGKYDLVAVADGGNVNSSNAYSGGINAIMGVAEKNTGGVSMYEQEYSNIKLPAGEVLSISGATIKLTCDAADGTPLVPRSQTITEVISLGSGNFVAGEDFPAGTYDLTAVSGGGNVNSDNAYDGGLNAIMGTSDKNTSGISMYEQSFLHADFPEGTTLTISGVSLELTPSL